MTREQRLDLLKQIEQDIYRLGSSLSNEAKACALRSTIEELEQEPCKSCCDGNQEEKAKLCQKSYLAGMKHCEAQEPCGDCISRQAVFEEIDDCNSDGLKGIFCSYKDGERFKEYIKELPPVTPQQETGCEGCIYEKTGNNSTYPCSHCSRCYTDKYKAESEG